MRNSTIDNNMWGNGVNMKYSDNRPLSLNNEKTTNLAW